GNDRIFADQKQDISVAYLAGETGIGTGASGDLLQGDGGDDELFAGADNDGLVGGAGSDLIYAGAGDDIVQGDGIVDPGSVTTANIGTMLPSSPTEGEADVIYAGAGADTVYAQGGDDFVDAGSGNDKMWGAGGADTLFGGAGNELMSGDSSDTAVAVHGDDYLDGEDGNDYLDDSNCFAHSDTICLTKKQCSAITIQHYLLVGVLQEVDDLHWRQAA
ncbi:MAG: hypothetical protein OEV73_07575, partial [Desulfobulbaceae bacterium]|nr:hypothetical protein [Desulfobulbaceae bacterium]